MDKLENIFDLQEELNTRIGVEMKSMTDEERIKWILNYIRAMQQELAELTDSVPFIPLLNFHGTSHGNECH